MNTPVPLEDHHQLSNHEQRSEEAALADVSLANQDPASLAHRVIDRLTATKLRLGSLRLHLHQGAVMPEEIEASLVQIEQEIDAAAELAQVLRARESGTG